MFDIGFAELIIIAVVGLLVIGPERLPSAIRTGSLWLSRIRRGFNDIKREVEQEIHNDAVLQELRETGERLKEQTNTLGGNIDAVMEEVQDGILGDDTGNEPKGSAEAPKQPLAAGDDKGDARPAEKQLAPEKKADDTASDAGPAPEKDAG